MNSATSLGDQTFRNNSVSGSIDRRLGLWQGTSTAGLTTGTIRRSTASQPSRLVKWTAAGILTASLHVGLVETLPTIRSAFTDPTYQRHDQDEDEQSFTQARQALAELHTVEDGWAGDGSVAPSILAIKNAVSFLSNLPETLIEPEVSPASDGYVGVYWESGRDIASVVFTDVGDIVYFAKNNGRVVARGKSKFSGTVPETLLNAILAI